MASTCLNNFISQLTWPIGHSQNSDLFWHLKVPKEHHAIVMKLSQGDQPGNFRCGYPWMIIDGVSLNHSATLISCPHILTHTQTSTDIFCQALSALFTKDQKTAPYDLRCVECVCKYESWETVNQTCQWLLDGQTLVGGWGTRQILFMNPCHQCRFGSSSVLECLGNKRVKRHFANDLPIWYGYVPK